MDESYTPTRAGLKSSSTDVVVTNQPSAYSSEHPAYHASTSQSVEKPGAPDEPSDHKLPIKIACVGDSLTYGFGASSSSRNYPADLQHLLGGKFMVRDYGVDGVTAQKEPHTREGSYWNKKFFRKSKKKQCWQ